MSDQKKFSVAIASKSIGLNDSRWAVGWFQGPDLVRSLCRNEVSTTHMRSLVIAFEEMLKASPQGSTIWLISKDSYLQDGIANLEKYKRSDWKKSDRKPIANADIWARLSEGSYGCKVHLSAEHSPRHQRMLERVKVMLQRQAA